jgi:hypothetical protein
MAKQPAVKTGDLSPSPVIAADETPDTEQQPAAVKSAYLYTGPVTSFDERPGHTRSLFPGRSYTDLPVDNPIIANLIERKLLTAELGEAAAPVETPAGA